MNYFAGDRNSRWTWMMTRVPETAAAQQLLDFLSFLRYVLSFHIIILYRFLCTLPHLPVVVASHLVVVAMSFFCVNLFFSLSTHLHTCTSSNQFLSSLSSKPSYFFIPTDCHRLKTGSRTERNFRATPTGLALGDTPRCPLTAFRRGTDLYSVCSLCKVVGGWD